MISKLKKLTDDEKVDKRQTRDIRGSGIFTDIICSSICNTWCGTKDGNDDAHDEAQNEMWVAQE